MSKRISNAETTKKIGEQAHVAGWVHAVRDHSKVLFIDLRDRTGLLQVVCFKPEMVEHVRTMALGREDVLQITGTVTKRPENLVNKNIPTGTVELQCEHIEVISKSETPPFEIENGITTDEEIRMQYRYLDLRRPEMLERMKLRHQVVHFIRNWMTDHDFIEIDTPMLTKDTPEGAREYLVPSRLHPGAAYALPQSPQQFKQLLMVASIERYFQIAKCLRDEDPRGDRQPEFTQLDMEMSFVEREDVMALNEQLLIDLVKATVPHKKIQQTPFPRLTYKEAMDQYGTDRPDLRKDKNDPNELAFVWITDFPFFEKDKEHNWTFTHNPFSAPKPESMDDLMQKKNIENIITSQYDITLNGYEIGGGSIRNHTAKALEKVFEIMGMSSERIQKNFGHMLKAFSYGTPPHGGIAWGLDRIIMLLAGAPNIREVIAFPKTGDGRDLMMTAPSPLSAEKLKELHLKSIE